MLTALLYGLAASSALLVGALVGVNWKPPRSVTGTLLAFASGALVGLSRSTPRPSPSRPP